MTAVSLTVVKTLFALSGNTCAYRMCEERLTDPAWSGVNADIAHIRGERPGAARYDETMPDEDRNSHENLILLCPNHHRVVDHLSPGSHPVALLTEMKVQHESRATNQSWATDAQFTRFALFAVLGLLMNDPMVENARAESARIIDEARDLAEQLRQELLARAEQDVVELRDRTRSEIEALVQAARDAGAQIPE